MLSTMPTDSLLREVETATSRASGLLLQCEPHARWLDAFGRDVRVRSAGHMLTVAGGISPHGDRHFPQRSRNRGARRPTPHLREPHPLGASGAGGVGEVPDQRANHRLHCCRPARLRQDRVHPRPLRLVGGDGVRAPGHEDHRESWVHGVHELGHVQAREFRHCEIGHYRVHRRLPEERESGRPALGRFHRRLDLPFPEVEHGIGLVALRKNHK